MVSPGAEHRPAPWPGHGLAPGRSRRPATCGLCLIVRFYLPFLAWVFRNRSSENQLLSSLLAKCCSLETACASEPGTEGVGVRRPGRVGTRFGENGVRSAQRSPQTFSSYYYGGCFIAQMSPLPPSLPFFFLGGIGGGRQDFREDRWGALRHRAPCAPLPSFGG